MLEHGDEKEAKRGEQDLGIAQVPELERRVGSAHCGTARGKQGVRRKARDEAGDDAGFVQTDERHEEADAGAKLCLSEIEIASAIRARMPVSVSSAKSTPLTNTAPRACCQAMPIAVRPKATKAFSPMYGATAIGRFG